MSPVSSVNNQNAVNPDANKSSLALNTNEFMQIMITELTNQDPFEPMSNQELMNQIATIQQIQSSQDMSGSFSSLMDRFDDMIVRDESSSASRLIGQLVSGTDTSGQFAMGKVVAVNLDKDQVFLELDTGQKISMQNMQRLGGSNSSDIVGELAIGMSSEKGRVVGKIDSVEVSEDGITLHLKVSGTQDDETVAVPLNSASIINTGTADLLIGYTVEGVDINDQVVNGVVQSVEWAADNKVILNLTGDKSVPLEGLTKIL